MGRQLGVAVVGLGIGEQHAIAFQGDARCQVRAVYDLDAGRAKEIAERRGLGTVVSSFDAILERSDIDVVSIASYDDAHTDQVCRALDAGKHVFAEKPLCQTRDEVVAIKQRWARNGGKLKLMCNLVLRAAPAYVWLKERIEAGDLGKIYAFDGDYLYGRLWKITEGWRGQVQDYSVMQGGGIHLVDLMLWLTRERPISITTVGNRICTEQTDFENADYMAATMTTASSMVARITANFGCVHPHQHVVRVFGTEATFFHDDCGPRLQRQRDPGGPACRVDASPLPASKGALIPSFVDAIVHDKNIDHDTQSIFDGIMISIASDDALRSGKTTEVQYI
jgi:predicted dehydrogenase